MDTAVVQVVEYFQSANLSATDRGKINTLIFHEWDEKVARNYMPEKIILSISECKDKDTNMDAIYDALFPADLKSE